jgi:Domain of unknown function (DUF1707)
VTAGHEDEIPEAGPGRRASHADREHVVGLLKAAFVQGRLTKDELDARLDRALVSRTYAELAALTADIPAGVTRGQPVREPAARRRGMGWVAVAVAAVLLAGLGVAVFTRAAGPPFTRAAGPFPAGLPRYYIQQSLGGAHGPATVVRATATGAVTATVRSPWRQAYITDIAAASDQTFFMVCWGITGKGGDAVVTGSRIYRFRVTGSGRIGGYSLVRGGMLAGLQAGGLAVAADGSEVAVTTVPAAATGAAGSAEIMVIDTRTGARAAWHNAPAVPGQMTYGVGGLSLTADGRELAFLAIPRCIKGPCAPTGNGEEVRAVSPAGRGGNLSSSRLLLRQSALVRLATGYIDGAVISPDGSSVAVVEMNTPAGSADNIVSVVQVSAATGKQLGVRYQADTGNGFLYRFFSSDPSGRYLLLDVGPTSGTVNGWIDDGRLVQLMPANGTNVFDEVW